MVPLTKVEIDQTKQLPTPEEQFRMNRKGYISLEDFIDVLKKFDYKKTNKDLIIKFLKALNCYFQPTNQVYYLKILRQLTGRTNNFNKLTNTFDYVKKHVQALNLLKLIILIENFHERSYRIRLH